MMRFVLAALTCLTAAGCFRPSAVRTFPSPMAGMPRQIRVQFVERDVLAVQDVALEDCVRATAISEFAPVEGEPEIVERMLEVQTVITRTYALSYLGRHAREGFDLCATTHCQLVIAYTARLTANFVLSSR